MTDLPETPKPLEHPYRSPFISEATRPAPIPRDVFPFGESDFLLLKPVRSTILASKPSEIWQMWVNGLGR